MLSCVAMLSNNLQKEKNTSLEKKFMLYDTEVGPPVVERSISSKTKQMKTYHYGQSVTITPENMLSITTIPGVFFHYAWTKQIFKRIYIEVHGFPLFFNHFSSLSSSRSGFFLRKEKSAIFFGGKPCRRKASVVCRRRGSS